MGSLSIEQRRTIELYHAVGLGLGGLKAVLDCRGYINHKGLAELIERIEQILDGVKMETITSTTEDKG